MLYPKDTEKWKQFTTNSRTSFSSSSLCCIPKILKNESNSQHDFRNHHFIICCVVSQRYWKMKAIHNFYQTTNINCKVVLYPKDTEKWKQFTTNSVKFSLSFWLCCIPKILKNESNSQQSCSVGLYCSCCVVSQRYWKMKAIHNNRSIILSCVVVVLYPKDTEKWKQFTTVALVAIGIGVLCCIPKILKNESNSQQETSRFPNK